MPRVRDNDREGLHGSLTVRPRPGTTAKRTQAPTPKRHHDTPVTFGGNYNRLTTHSDSTLRLTTNQTCQSHKVKRLLHFVKCKICHCHRAVNIFSRIFLKKRCVEHRRHGSTGSQCHEPRKKGPITTGSCRNFRACDVKTDPSIEARQRRGPISKRVSPAEIPTCHFRAGCFVAFDVPAHF